MKSNLVETTHFLRALDASASEFTFQTFDDSSRKDPSLARVLHGTFEEHRKKLLSLSSLGAGVYVTINATDGKGRKTENITRVRALFVDLDGAPLDPCLKAPLQPQTVVVTSPGRYHAYWFVKGMPLDQFGGVQRALIERFNADPSVHDLPRVMRLPGFPNLKKGKSHLVRILSSIDVPPYPASDFALKAPSSDLAPPVGDVIASPGRHEALTSLARTLSARGVCYEAILACLEAVNRHQCRPPLTGARLAELPKIAGWAASKPVLSPMVEDDDVTVSEEILNMSAEDLAAAYERSKA